MIDVEDTDRQLLIALRFVESASKNRDKRQEAVEALQHVHNMLDVVRGDQEAVRESGIRALKADHRHGTLRPDEALTDAYNLLDELVVLDDNRTARREVARSVKRIVLQLYRAVRGWRDIELPRDLSLAALDGQLNRTIDALQEAKRLLGQVEGEGTP